LLILDLELLRVSRVMLEVAAELVAAREQPLRHVRVQTAQVEFSYSSLY
jgi:hypothetical protein